MGFVSFLFVAKAFRLSHRQESFIKLYLPPAYFFALSTKLFRFSWTRIWRKVGNSEFPCPTAEELFLDVGSFFVWLFMLAIPGIVWSIHLGSTVLFCSTLSVASMLPLRSTILFLQERNRILRKRKTSRQRRREARAQEAEASESKILPDLDHLAQPA